MSRQSAGDDRCARATPVSIGFGEPDASGKARDRRRSSWSCRGCGRNRWSRRRRCCRPCAWCRRRGGSCRGRRGGLLNAASAARRCARVPAGTGMTLVSAWQNLERLVAGKDERDLVGDRIHRVPCSAVVLRLSTAGKSFGLALELPRCHDGLRAVEVGLQSSKDR